MSTTARDVRGSLGKLVAKISDENYDQTLASFRLWIQISQTHFHERAVRIPDCLYDNRGSSATNPKSGKLIHPTAHLIIRLAKDAESGRVLSPLGIRRKTRLCTRVLHQFFSQNVGLAMGRVYYNKDWDRQLFCADANFVAHFANMGYIKKSVIRNHILQSLISHPAKLYDHQADALIILFKIAGAMFEKYVDRSVVDRCFERLEYHYTDHSAKNRLVQVRVVSCDRWPLRPG